MVVAVEREIGVYTGDFDSDLASIRFLKDAQEITGRFSKPGKMPCYGYNLPASKCKTGGKLKNVEGSVCFGCYAADDWDWRAQTGKGASRYPSKWVVQAMAKKFAALDDPMWVPAMVFQIKWYDQGYFRWHDSGDIQSVAHLRNIAIVAENTPDTQHWLPTREYGMINSYKEMFGDFPPNLCVRASAHMVDGKAPSGFDCVSSVRKDKPIQDGAQACPAPTQDNQCKDCRACWDNQVYHISYKEH